jgi:hypothetical protein
MSKCTKIFDNLYLNLKQIVTFEVVADEQLKIITSAHPETNESIMLITFSSDADTVLGRATEGFIYVKLQELHRIKREISKFMGIKEPKIKQAPVAA